MDEKIAEILAHLWDAKCSRYWDKARKENIAPIPGESFHYVPLHTLPFIRLAITAFQHSEPPIGKWRKNFIDAGCGPGYTLELASAIGFSDIEGVELNKYHAKRAKKKGFKIHVANMLTLDYRNYSVVYSYIPIYKFEEFTHRVSREARVGAVFIGCCGGRSPSHWPLPPEGKYETVYKDQVKGVVIKKIGE